MQSRMRGPAVHNEPPQFLEHTRAWSPDSSQIVASSGSITVWTKAGESWADRITLTTSFDCDGVQNSFDHSFAVGYSYCEAVAYAPNGNYIAVGSTMGHVLVYRTSDWTAKNSEQSQPRSSR